MKYLVILTCAVWGARANLEGPFLFFGPASLEKYRRPALAALSQDELTRLYAEQAAVVVFGSAAAGGAAAGRAAASAAHGAAGRAAARAAAALPRRAPRLRQQRDPGADAAGAVVGARRADDGDVRAAAGHLRRRTSARDIRELCISVGPGRLRGRRVAASAPRGRGRAASRRPVRRVRRVRRLRRTGRRRRQTATLATTIIHLLQRYGSRRRGRNGVVVGAAGAGAAGRGCARARAHRRAHHQDRQGLLQRRRQLRRARQPSQQDLRDAEFPIERRVVDGGGRRGAGARQGADAGRPGRARRRRRRRRARRRARTQLPLRPAAALRRRGRHPRVSGYTNAAFYGKYGEIRRCLRLYRLYDRSYLVGFDGVFHHAGGAGRVGGYDLGHTRQRPLRDQPRQAAHRHRQRVGEARDVTPRTPHLSAPLPAPQRVQRTAREHDTRPVHELVATLSV